MANLNTKIEWTDATWSPVTGCSKVSAGCKNCYAERVFPRAYGKDRAFTDIQCHPERLDQPLRWKKPRRIFVNSMSDLFHESVGTDFVDQVFAVMALAKEHTFQVLTKRPEAMRRYLEQKDPCCLASAAPEKYPCSEGYIEDRPWPLPNVWLGVSVENREQLSRIDILRQTPAAVRFVSLEPVLEDLGNLPFPPKGATYRCSYCGDFTTAPFASMRAHPWDFKSACGKRDGWCGSFMGDDGKPVVDWVIVGGESGPHARPCNVQWIRSIVEQCKAVGVPVFCKQLGSWAYSERGVPHPIASDALPIECLGRLDLRDRKGADICEFPEDLKVREWPK